MTFLQMQTDAIDLLHELENYSSVYTLAKLKQYLNRGSVEFVRKTQCIESTIDITTVADQFEYDESDQSGLQYLQLPYQVRYVDGDEVGEKLIPFRGGYTNLPKTKIYGTPSTYWLRNIGGKSRATIPSAFTGFRIGTWPICGTSDNTIRIDAYMWPVTLVGDTHVPEYKDAYHDAPVFYAAYRMFMNASHLRKSWRQKALDNKALFDEIVVTANDELSVQDDAPFLPIDVTQEYGY